MVSVLSGPEFQAGITAWGAKIGNPRQTALRGAAEAMERIDAAIAPLLDKACWLWLTGLQAPSRGTPFVVDIKPTVTELKRRMVG